MMNSPPEERRDSSPHSLTSSPRPLPGAAAVIAYGSDTTVFGRAAVKGGTGARVASVIHLEAFHTGQIEFANRKFRTNTNETGEAREGGIRHQEAMPGVGRSSLTARIDSTEQGGGL